MSVYSSTDQINLLKNIFKPEFQFGGGGFFQPTVKTYLPGSVEIGDPTTNYSLVLNGNALATDLSIAAWSVYPAVSSIDAGTQSVINVSSIQFLGGNSVNGTTAALTNLSGVQTINGFNISLGSALTIGTEVIRLGQSTQTANTSVSDQVCIGSNAGSANAGESLVAIGWGAGNGGPGGVRANASGFVVSIGRAAGQSNLAGYGVFVGYYAGERNSGTNTVGIGISAGIANKGSNVVALGYQAAGYNSSSDVVAIGTNAAYNNSGQFVVGIGNSAANLNTGSSVVSIGNNAGYKNSGSNCIFLGSNVSTTGNTVSDTFYVYSRQGVDVPFLQGDMSGNTLGIGQAPVAGFGLAVKGSIQHRINISAVTSSPLILTTANAASRFFVSNALTLSFGTFNSAQSGTHWIVTNTSTSAVIANLCGGTVQNSISSVTLPATISGVGRGVTFAYTGVGTNFYSF
jgi:hypothetical protein